MQADSCGWQAAWRQRQDRLQCPAPYEFAAYPPASRPLGRGGRHEQDDSSTLRHVDERMLDPGEFRFCPGWQSAKRPSAVIGKPVPPPVVDPEWGAGDDGVGDQGGEGIGEQGVPGGDAGSGLVAWSDTGPAGNEEEPEKSDPGLSLADVLAVAGDSGIALKGAVRGCSEKVSAAAGEVEDDRSVTGQIEHQFRYRSGCCGMPGCATSS